MGDVHEPLSPTLFGRVILANAVVLVSAAALLAATPFNVSYPAKAGELLVLGIGVAVMIAVDGVLVRRALAPVAQLRASMSRLDPVVPGERVKGPLPGGDVAELAVTFNAMADRLEAERRESARRSVAGREAERSALARELHDEVGQTLTAVLAQLQRTLRSAPPELRGEIVEAQNTIRSGLEEIRRVVDRLRPDTLEDLGLASALRALSRRMGERSGVVITPRLTDPLPPLEREAELVVYRIAQEALTNSVRHASARHVELSLAWTDAAMTLLVRDDGTGLPERLGLATGIRGMHERALLVGGRLHVGPAPKRGTEVRLDVPVLEAHR